MKTFLFCLILSFVMLHKRNEVPEVIIKKAEPDEKTLIDRLKLKVVSDISLSELIRITKFDPRKIQISDTDLVVFCAGDTTLRHSLDTKCCKLNRTVRIGRTLGYTPKDCEVCRVQK